MNISASYIQDYEWAMGFLMNMIVFSVFTLPYLPLRLKYVSLHYTKLCLMLHVSSMLIFKVPVDVDDLHGEYTVANYNALL